MVQQKKEKKKGSMLSWIAAAFILFSFVGEDIGGVAAVAVVIAILIIAVLIKVGKKKSTEDAAPDHSHSRYSSKGDLKIDRRTGKVSARPVRTQVQHTGQEHWKQQLDVLLENGTIDRTEYREMLKQYQ